MPNKTSRSFRLEPESLQQLARLSGKWGISQARVLELLIDEAVAEDKTLKMEIISGSGADRGRATSGQ